jgi:hypothetical protein
MLLIAVSFNVFVFAQKDESFGSISKTQIKHNLEYHLETVALTGSGPIAPFWHTSNRQGLPSVNNNSGYMHFAALGSMSLPSGIVMDYGADLGVGAGGQSDLFVHQLYIDLDYKWLNLSVGMKERWGELKNSRLSSGGLTWSGNGRPIPQVRLGLPEFVRLPILDNWFSVKAHIAYGRLIDDRWRSERAAMPSMQGRYTDKILFNSKDLFLRFGNPSRIPFQVTLGIEMYCLFGGTMHNRPLTGLEVYEEYNLPSGPAAYLTALVPVNEPGNQGKENGNNLGSWHLSLDYLGKEWGIRAYYEHFFEDHSSMIGVEYKSDLDGTKNLVYYGFRRNWFDGLYGLEISLPERFPVSNVLVEVLNTRGQCGPIRKDQVYPIIEGVDGRDDMYNHDLYDSYSMSGYALGSPILVSPVYNNDGNQCFRSNRVLMYHVGIDGGFGARWKYRAFFTNTTHWGTYENPFNVIQDVTSCLFEGSYLFSDVNKWRIGLSVGFDLNDGDLIGNNTGVMFTIAKSWKIL